jgi:type IV pilus assembly protein PilP
MKSSLRLDVAFVIGVLLMTALSACGDDPPKPSGKGKEQTAEPEPKEVATPTAVAAPVDTTPPPKMEFRDTDFVETEQNRDPFRPFTEAFSATVAGRVQQHRKVVLEEYAIDDLKLIGIVSRINPAKAMLVDPTGKGHVVHRGDFIGKAERVQVESADAEFELTWRIERIRDSDLVLVREDPSNPDVPTATRVLALRPEEGPVE